MPDRDVWAELAAFLAHLDATGDVGHLVISREIRHHEAGDWAIACEFGREAPDSPMSGGAAYGIDPDLETALAQALDDLSPRSRGLVDA